VSPIWPEVHTCHPPSTWNRTRYAEWECSCGRCWYLSWFPIRGEMLGPSWILDRGLNGNR
jgi:hypothetical protein